MVLTKKATSMSPAEYPPVDVNINHLTPRELSDLWKNAGLSAEDLENPMNAEDPGQALAAIAWIVTRRTFPDMTLEEAWDVPIALDGSAADPTNASN